VGDSAGALFTSLIVSTIGAALFLYGKKARRLPQALGGFALIVAPYLLPGVAWTLVLGVAVCAGVWTASRAGW
jgi:hypothetical protein